MIKCKSYKYARQEEIIERATQLEDHSLRSKYGDEAVKALQEFSIAPRNKGKLGNGRHP